MILRGKYNGAKMSTEALDLHLILTTQIVYKEYWVMFLINLILFYKLNLWENSLG